MVMSFLRLCRRAVYDVFSERLLCLWHGDTILSSCCAQITLRAVNAALRPVSYHDAGLCGVQKQAFARQSHA